MRKALVPTIALLATLALPGVAGAHIDVAPTETPAGKTAKLDMVIGHGCDGAATTSVVVQVPGSVKDATAKATAGWKASNSKGRMKWTGGPLPDHDLQELPFTAKFYGNKGAGIPLKLIQGCEGGKTTAWIQVAPEGAPEPETPAPVVTLTSTAKAPAAVPVEEPSAGAGEGQPSGTNGEQSSASDVPDSSEEDEGLADGMIIAIFAGIAIAILAGVFYMIRRTPDE